MTVHTPSLLDQINQRGQQYANNISAVTDSVDRLSGYLTKLNSHSITLGSVLENIGLASSRTGEEIDALKRKIVETAQLDDININPDKMLSAIDTILDKTGDLNFVEDNLNNIAIAIKSIDTGNFEGISLGQIMDDLGLFNDQKKASDGSAVNKSGFDSAVEKQTTAISKSVPGFIKDILGEANTSQLVDSAATATVIYQGASQGYQKLKEGYDKFQKIREKGFVKTLTDHFTGASETNSSGTSSTGSVQDVRVVNWTESGFEGSSNDSPRTRNQSQRSRNSRSSRGSRYNKKPNFFKDLNRLYKETTGFYKKHKNTLSKIGKNTPQFAKQLFKAGKQKILEAGASVKASAKSALQTVKSNTSSLINKGREAFKSPPKFLKNGLSSALSFGKSLPGKILDLGKRSGPLRLLTGATDLLNTWGSNKSTSDKVLETGGIVGGASGAALGATIGTFILPGIGTALGGFLGGMAGEWLGENAAEQANAALNISVKDDRIDITPQASSNMDITGTTMQAT